MGNKIIDSSDPGIVLSETSVQLSDEKLRALLSNTYEEAQIKADEIRFYKFYNVFLSVAATLFLSLLTSSFDSIGKISSETVTKIAWFFCISAAIIGFICLGVTVTKKTHYNTSIRDETVDKILEKYISKQ